MCIFLFIGKKYPVIETFRDGKVKTCENDKLKLKKSYKVDRIEKEKSPPEWEFKATLDEKVLSSLDGEKGGICNVVSTFKGSRGCGLATTLMEHCFTDENVGSLDIQNNKFFEGEPFKKRRDMATKNCEHTVYLMCSVIAGPEVSCSGYLTAAINTKHTMMFTKNLDQMHVMNVAKAQPEFKKDATNWLKEYGKDWVFCKCKSDKMDECGKMS